MKVPDCDAMQPLGEQIGSFRAIPTTITFLHRTLCNEVFIIRRLICVPELFSDENMKYVAMANVIQGEAYRL